MYRSRPNCFITGVKYVDISETCCFICTFAVSLAYMHDIINMIVFLDVIGYIIFGLMRIRFC